MKVYIIPVGRLRLPDKGHMTPGLDVGTPIDMPVYCYLIEHEKCLTLIDTGVDHNGVVSFVEEGQDIVSQLDKLGYAPSDINYVIMTHLHVDHAAYMSSFPDSTFIVRKEEMRAAWWPEKCEGGYVYWQYKDTRDFDFMCLPDDVDYDMFGDGKVILTDTRGHTRGHQSIVLKLDSGERVIITGDATSLRDNLEKKIQPGVCTNNWDALYSIQKIRHYQQMGYTVWFGHEPSQEAELKLAPEFYE